MRAEVPMNETKSGESAAAPARNGLRAFWDFLVLFSGISTASNLSRTRKDPIQSRGLFLFRSGRPRLLGRRTDSRS
jgi:hypothetical protein